MSGLALFDEPLRITFSDSSVSGGSRAGLLAGLATEGQSLRGVVILEDGKLCIVDAAWFSIDYRYDAELDRFTDQNVPRPDQEG